MGSEEVKLLGVWDSPYVHRVEWALKLKGVEYEFVEEDLSNKSPLLLKYNPIHKKVPVLVYAGKAISESLVIIEYIDETWKQNPILPEDPYERANARFWAKFIEEKVIEVIKQALHLEGEKQENKVKQAIEALEILEGELKNNKEKFFGGEMIGFVDIVLGYCLAGSVIHQTIRMGSEEVKLLGAWASPFVHRVEWALKLKGVEYEYIEEDLSNKSPLLLKYNPIHKKVPVLIHAGKPISESFVIIEYIDDTWKQNPVFPEDPYQRAKARFWAKFVDEKFTKAIRLALLSEGEQQEKEVKQAIEALEIIEGELKSKEKFFGGEKIGFVDIVLGWVTALLEVVEEVAGIKVFDSQKFPSFNKWMENFVETPIIKDKLPSREKFVIYFHKARQFSLASPTTK
ncbi:hypothetical protein HHK36_000561 [Tetracentron sinense]|uniref:glutathione transferase n=1 Tax=Tetracentron sinense TaxID=13715 RepID=A0A835DU45_TETSI|nr:hypothetical protein HHK36_000561 [Tetracentron sinense]